MIESDATHATSKPTPLKHQPKKAVEKKIFLDSTDPEFNNHMVYMDYDATINDPNATKLQRKRARAYKKQQEKRKRNRTMGLTTEGKLGVMKFAQEASQDNQRPTVPTSSIRVPNEEGHVTAVKVSAVGNDVIDLS